ncbi:hypothetical protein HXX76_015461 [Chlamydomonas incerta]|uniref:Uncharacterized protein n=1 Tax=Chlamydomonas incerta TaxID=51695 RepID=A0A835VRY6_CHLIN|nr:hypothetical protein HXX76_015461 [Chlamydomonas incerta]|eukprot:KAG2423314.1 hypothetical protein HXX76_015461 [Chlamydomonas incerta]
MEPQPEQQLDELQLVGRTSMLAELRGLGVRDWQIERFTEPALDLLLQLGVAGSVSRASRASLLHAGLGPSLVEYIASAQGFTLGILSLFFLLPVAGLLLHGTAMGNQMQMAGSVFASIMGAVTFAGAWPAVAGVVRPLLTGCPTLWMALIVVAAGILGLLLVVRMLTTRAGAALQQGAWKILLG